MDISESDRQDRLRLFAHTALRGKQRTCEIVYPDKCDAVWLSILENSDPAIWYDFMDCYVNIKPIEFDGIKAYQARVYRYAAVD